MNLKDNDQNIKNSIPGLLLGWYGANARILPWRADPTSYRVWLSEVMLQQTRVETVLPYFQEFIQALPDIKSLAGADEQRLHKLWEGLGYYSRVRNMQRAAAIVLEQYDGRLPADYRLLLALPGIGDYTAGAVASIAFGLPVPAVDGNVLRVLSRLLASEADITLPQTKKHLREVAADLVPRQRPGDFNQAMMELGATVCLPGTQPRCAGCPLRQVCEGLRLGIAGRLPVKSPKKARSVEQKTVLLIVADHRVLLRRRDEAGLLAGLWEFPNFAGELTQAQIEASLADMAVRPADILPLGRARHIFTHREWHMQGYLVSAAAQGEAMEGYVWADYRQLQNDYALPSAFKAYFHVLDAQLEGLQAIKQLNR